MKDKIKELTEIIGQLTKERNSLKNQVIDLKTQLEIKNNYIETLKREFVEKIDSIKLYEETLKEDIEKYNLAKKEYKELANELKKDITQLQTDREKVLKSIKRSNRLNNDN